MHHLLGLFDKHNVKSAHFNLGTALLQKGDKTGALDEYKILKKLDKETADNLFNKIYY